SGRCLCAVSTFASVDIADQNAAFAISRHVKEIEQVATNVCSAFGPDASALQRSVWCGVRCGPVRTAVKRVGDVEMPNTIEGRLQRISRCSGSVEGDRRAAVIAGDGCRIPDVPQAIRGPDIAKVLPGRAVIG